MSEVKIIIVDDHKMIRGAWKQLIELRNNMKVIGEAENGKVAVQLTKKLKPDIVLMDLNMPEMNGVDATKMIKAKMPWVKVIALTVQTEFAFIKSMIRHGAEGFITKNSDKEELYEAIERVMDGGTFICKEVNDILVRTTISKVKGESKELTRREVEIIQFIGQGLTSSEIAEKLFINVKTIESHRRNIFKKLDIKNAAQLMKIASEKGLIFKK